MNSLLMRMEREAEHRAMLRSLLASFLLHLAIILGIAWLVANSDNIPQVAVAIPEEITLTIVEAPKPKPMERRFIETTQEAAEAPSDAAFEADRNSRAASQQPPTGTLLLPSQQGIESPAIAFENRQYTPDTQPQLVAQTMPTVITKPAEISNPQQQVKQTPKPTPIASRSQSQLALLDPIKEAIPKPARTPEQSLMPPETAEKPITPTNTGYQPEKRVTRITGGVGQAGENSVAAVSTPLGQYRKDLSDAIGKRWYSYVKRDMSLLSPGTAEIRFTILPDGKVEKIKVLHNTSNRSFEVISAKAISDAAVPPIPSDLVPALEGNRIEVDFSFTILGN